MKKRNLKTVEIVLTERGLHVFNTIPTYRELLQPAQVNSLVVGKNILNVGHYAFPRLINFGKMQGLDIAITEI